MSFISRINFRQLSQYIPAPIRNIDWKVGVVIAGALSALAIVAYRYKNATSQLTIQRPSLKNVTPKDLGFTEAQLKEKSVPHPDKKKEMSFGEFCSTIIKLLVQHENNRSISIDLKEYRNSDFWLNCGLPEGATFEFARPDQRENSWLNRSLKALLEHRYIRRYDVGSKDIKIDI